MNLRGLRKMAFLLQEKVENEDADVTTGDSEPLVITTLKNEKYHCIYDAPDNSDQVWNVT